MNHKTEILRSVIFPGFFVGVLWLISFAGQHYDLNLVQFGLYPRRFSGILGILFSPLIHHSFYHLFSNTIPLLILGGIMFYFYKSIAFSVFGWVYVMTGIWVWVAGRDAYHIGASGLVYGFVSFLFFSGVFRRDKKLLALSMLVVFIYGGLVWDVLPLRRGISWESHLLGSIAGIITAFHFRKEGPQPQKYEWEDEDDSGDLTEQNDQQPGKD